MDTMFILSIIVGTAVYPSAALGQTVSTVPNATSQVLSHGLQYNGYGIHQPQGLDAVLYLYGDEGTWKQYTGLENIYGYYNVPKSELEMLIAYANGSNPATCSDPDNNVLFNLAYESATASGTSFEEHNGRGVGGAIEGQPFSQFWFDDNWLARYMSLAYGAPQPEGLFASRTRWQILGLEANGWPLPGGSQPDQLALLGLYNIALGDPATALMHWNSILNAAGEDYDSNNTRYTYSGLGEEYYIGLFKILTDRLMDAGISDSDQAKLFQHSLSLRSNILSEQQANLTSGSAIGWITSRTVQSSLINTETTSIQVLALGAGARYSFEAGVPPMANPPSFSYGPYDVLSAVVGQSNPGVMSYGPNVTLPIGNYYSVDFYMRSQKPGNLTVHLDVHDSNSNQILGKYDVSAGQFPDGNQWGRFSIGVNITNPKNQMEFRVDWGGEANLDLSAIRVR